MGQASPGPQGSPMVALVRIVCFILALAAVGVPVWFLLTNRVTGTLIATAIALLLGTISGFGQWLFPQSPSNLTGLQQTVSTRIKSSWPLLLFAALILAVTSCVTWMVVTGNPLINILLAAILSVLSALCLLAVAVMSIIDLVKKKSTGKGTKLSINWILLKLSARQMLYVLVFLVLLILTLSTSLFYTLRIPSLSSIAAYPGKTSFFSLIPSLGFHYVFSLALSCQANMGMIYEEKTLIFESSSAFRPKPNPPVAAPVIALITSIIAFVSSPLGMSFSLIVFVFILASTFI